MKWEYVRVALYSADNPIKPSSVYVVGDDGKEVKSKKQSGDSSHAPVVSRLLAKLGDEGWELSGVVQAGTGSSAVLYFKRPKP